VVCRLPTEPCLLASRVSSRSLDRDQSETGGQTFLSAASRCGRGPADRKVCPPFQPFRKRRTLAMSSLRVRFMSSGGWNRTSGLHVQSVASRPTATAPECDYLFMTAGSRRRFGKEDSNLHRLVQSQGACRLADSRECPAGVEPACPVWKTGA
jgi:hypothetical protein